ncbi:MAG TPA: condensation domain-containing protein, partial [Chloroflexia bacterium]|nr:condensation domain-containing protein [Chloroflexia bacterium]
MTQQIIEGSRLSPQQRRIWRLAQWDGGGVYRAQCAVRVDGALEAGRLRRALAEVVERHEILRTSFRLLAGMSVPLQVVGAGAGAWDWDEVDVSGVAQGDEQWREVWQQYEELGAVGETTAGGAEVVERVLRVRLVKLSETRHVLLVRLSALCGDAATLRNLVREVSREYGAATQPEHQQQQEESVGEGGSKSDRESEEEEWAEVLQYADLAEWQNELLEAEETAAGRLFWLRARAGEQGKQGQEFGVAYERRRNEEEREEFAPCRVVVALPAGLGGRIDELGRREGVTAREVMLGSWAVLIWRLREQSETVIATAFAGRGDEALEGALGPFVKYLPVRPLLEENLRFKELL